jgi:membrane protein YqaA with SNARE-associated domain
MKTVLAWIKAFAAAIGGPGLFIIAFLDSSFLSFPQVNDLLVISMVVQHPSWMIYYAGMATAGSVAGCLAIYYVARKGGDALVRRRFKGRLLERAHRLVERYGVLTLLVPAILPPPAPFKVFVLLAGASRMSVGPFAAAIAVGRGIRYFGIGLLTVWYGPRAITFLEENGRITALAIAGLVLVLGAAYLLWKRLRRRDGALTPASGADIMP